LQRALRGKSESGYGTREFGIRDPDGYVLAFAEESDPAVE
jgi:hypothetical protein